MSRQFRFILGTLPCVAALATGAFAQTAPSTTTGAAGATSANSAATTTTATTPAPTAVPVAVPTGAATTTTTQTTVTPTDMGMAPVAPVQRMPHAGGDPAEFVLLGGALSVSMLALRRRFAR